MATTTATELAQFGALVTTDPATSTVTVNGTLTATTITLPNSSVTAAKLANPQYTGFRNRIINGDMRIDQRNAGASVTYDGGASYSLDRYFSAEIGNGAFTVQQVSDAPSGFTKSLKVTVTTAQTGTLNAATIQQIEGFNTADFAWGTASASPVTISFWVKSSVTGTLGGCLCNSATNRSYPFSYTVSSANTWEQKSITIAGDTSGTWLTDNGVGIMLRFTHGTSLTGTAGAWAGADYRGPTGATWVIQTLSATWQITGVQLEAGSTATEFERRPIGTELALCQRYFQSYGGQSANDMVCMGATNSTSYFLGILQLPVTMRTSPTVGFSSASALSIDDNASTGTSSVIATASLGYTSVHLAVTTGATMVINRPARAYTNGSSARLTWSAEL